MKFKPNYLIIPVIAVGAAVAGRWLTEGGMPWYRTLRLPDYTPPGQVIGAVWTLIYTMSSAAALIVWNRFPRTAAFRAIWILFVVNVVLNVLWSLLFFRLHTMGLSTIDSALIEATVLALIVLQWPRSRPAALLLVPYAAWVAFATWLNFVIWSIN